MNWLTFVWGCVWIYVLSVLRRGKMDFWYFLWGSVGMFVFIMILIQPILTVPLTRGVTIVSGFIGQLFNLFEGVYEYSLIFIPNKSGAISLMIDYECAGIIEMAAFVSLVMFFPGYIRMEKVLVNIFGILYLFLSNVLRVVVICSVIALLGNKAYFITHTIIGRIIFYGLSMLLYYVVFTRTQIIRQKVGNFRYEDE